MADPPPNPPPRLALVAEGDAETKDCWSGSAMSFVRALRRRGAEVVTVDAEPHSLGRLALALRTFRVDRRSWKAGYSFGLPAFRERSARARRSLAPLGPSLDAVIQIGATFLADAGTGGLPRFVYIDANIHIARQGLPYVSVQHLPDEAREAVERREGEVYSEANGVWTMSAYAAASVVKHFNVPPGRVRPIYAGPNSLTLDKVDAEPSVSEAPRILFVGKDHRRKGLEVLLRAFARTRRRVPDAELHVLGTRLPEPEPGVIYYGFVSGAESEGQELIQDLFRSATVFCLPSRYEPFGIAFLEAMHCGVPCIGVDQWAMPEIIEAGKTGWLVPDGEVEPLESALIDALTDRERSARMGRAARERAARLFTWDHTARRALEDLASRGFVDASSLRIPNTKLT